MTVVITKKQSDTCDKAISLFNELNNLTKDYPNVYGFLKSTYFPDFLGSKKQPPSSKAIKHKVLAEIYLQDDIDNNDIESLTKAP